MSKTCWVSLLQVFRGTVVRTQAQRKGYFSHVVILPGHTVGFVISVLIEVFKNAVPGYDPQDLIRFFFFWIHVILFIAYLWLQEKMPLVYEATKKKYRFSPHSHFTSASNHFKWMYCHNSLWGRKKLCYCQVVDGNRNKNCHVHVLTGNLWQSKEVNLGPRVPC